jgi:hypothetical protein
MSISKIVASVTGSKRDGVPLSPRVIQDVVDSMEQIAIVAAKSARATLVIAADQAGVRILAAPERNGAVTASYVEKTGHFVNCLEEAALLCDSDILPRIP